MSDTRRVRVSRETLRQCEHHLTEYHKLFIVWGLKLIEQTKPGLQREKNRDGIQKYFNEISSSLAIVKEHLGHAPKTIEEALAEMQTPEYKKLVDKVKVQAYVYRTKRAIAPWRWPLLAWNAFLTGIVRGIMILGSKMRGDQA